MGSGVCGSGVDGGEFNTSFFSLCLYYLNKFNRNYNFTDYTVIMSRLTALIILYSCIT